MRLVYKLLLILLFAAIVPLGISSYFALRTSQENLARDASDRHTRDARELARAFDHEVGSLRGALETQLQLYSATFARDRDVVRKAMYQIYQSDSRIDCVTLLDEDGNEMKAKTVGGVLIEPLDTICKIESSGDAAVFQGHATVVEQERHEFERVAREFWNQLARGKPEGRELFWKQKPMKPARRAPFVSKVREAPVTALAFPVVGPSAAKWLFVVQVSLESLQNRILAFSAVRSGGAFVFDDQKRVVAHPDKFAVLESRSVVEFPVARDCAERQEFDLGGERVLASCFRLTEESWSVVVFQPTRTLFKSVNDLRDQSLFWIAVSLALAIGVAVFFARGISRPVGELARGARAIGAGAFDTTIPVRARDEIGLLAATFNAMGGALKTSRAEIERQNEEIRQWNEELQARVDARTRELRSAQDQLLQSQKLAAVGELGAGVAHEINNPLAGVLGLTQLLLLRTKPEEPSHRSLKSIERESLKIRDIVSNLLRFSQEQAGAGAVQIEAHQVLDDALTMVQNQLMSQNIDIVRAYEPNLPKIIGDSAALQQAVLHIISNAKNAMPKGGKLTLTTDALEDKVVNLRIGDTGRGISKEHLERIFEPFFTTKDEWSGKGLGLSVAYRIVTEHKGKISVVSEVGEGSTFTISLPAVARGTQLV